MNQRKPHYLKQLKRDSVPTRIVFADCESHELADARKADTFHHQYRLGVAHYVRISKGRVSREDWWTSTRPETFWDWLLLKTEINHPVWVFCHSANYWTTLMKFWEAIEQNRLQFYQKQRPRYKANGNADLEDWHGLIVIEDPPFMLRCRFKDTQREIVIVDVQNYFREPLESIAKMVSIEPMSDLPPDAKDDIWYMKCERDVAIIRESMLSLIEMVRNDELGNFAMTISGQAMAAFRRKFLGSDHRVYIHDCLDALAMERAAYYGGVAEPRFIGKIVKKADTQLFGNAAEPGGAMRNGPVYVLDATAFYPSIMVEYNFPTFLNGINIGVSLDQLKEIMQRAAVVAEVQIETVGGRYPVRFDQNVIHATGTFWTTLAGPELARAVEEDKILRIGRVAEYSQERLFQDFVLYFWEKRKLAAECRNRPMELCVKLLMNSLYGKFAQKSHQWELDTETQAPYPVGYFYSRNEATGERVEFRSIGWEVQRHQKPQESFDSFPAISAYVTSYGRVKLHKWIAIAGPRNVYYVDTDCLHTNAAGYQALVKAGEVSPGEMGKLKLAGKHETAIYRGPKNYRLDDKDVIAGLQKSAKQLSENTYEQKIWTSLAAILEKREFGYIAVEKRSFHCVNEPCQGRVTDDGIVHPPVLRHQSPPKIRYGDEED